MTSSLTPTILCSACGKANEPDSRFCRYCGASLAGAQAAPVVEAATVTTEENGETFESKIDAHAPMIDHSIAAVGAQTAATHAKAEKALDGEDDKLSSPAEFDARRSRQLLDRSLHLSERGDTSGAILACRQSIALAPTAPGGYSMLGLLLERINDLPRALNAYEKAVQLAPQSTLERESVERLREKLGGPKAAEIFHFDDAELFGEDAKVKTAPKSELPVEQPTEKPIETPVPIETPAPKISAAAPGLPADYGNASDVTAVPTTEPADAPAKVPYKPTLAQGLAGQIPAAAKLLATAPDIADRRSKDRRVESIPVTVERRLRLDRRGPSIAAPKSSRGIAPIFLDNGTPQSSSWNRLWQRPSYFGRSLPLAGATVLCLGFLLWARSYAVARSANKTVVAAVPGGVAPSDPTPAPLAPGQEQPVNFSDSTRVGAPPVLAPVGSSSQSSGFPISNLPVTASGQPASAGTSRPAASGGGGSSPNISASQRRSTPSFPKMIPPAPIPSSAIRSGSSNGGGSSNSSTPSASRGNNGIGGLGLPAPTIDQAAPANPPTVIPSSSNGPALNPAGQSGRGYVRITQGKIGVSSMPRRPAAQAGDDERGAADDTRNGQTDRAVDRLSSAINADSNDAGYRYQQRAMLFLDRGDYSRAADDFQAAITAYGEQINRGDQVNAARAGQRAARNGLNLALAGKSR